jgi:type III pantothenate kinase
MILAIDMGNTNTVIGGIDEKKTYFIERVTTDQSRTATEYAVSFKNILEMCGIDVADIEGAILSSVVPPLNSVILTAVEKVTGIRPLLVGSGMKTGMNILMDNPKSVGSDQIVDAVAASHEHPLPLIVIDMGTATTIGVISEGRNYEGGMLLPGVNVSLEALSRRAAQLPAISLQHPKVLIGKTTEDCMRSGIVYGTAGMLDGVIDRIREQFSGRTLSVVATGGNAPVIVKYCRNKIVYDKYLLMDGLWAIYQKNK